MPDKRLYGGIELGGTKTLAAVGYGDGGIVARVTMPTAAPEMLLPALGAFFAAHADGGALAGIGVGAFGPIVIDPAAMDYGRLLETNKPGWSGFDLVGGLAAVNAAPISLATDVAVAGIGEARHGALRGIGLGVYLTVGTGIGGAILHNGRLLPAALHPEIGHIPVLPHPDDRSESLCRFHPNCAEGLAAGPAITARFGASLSHFPAGGVEQQLIADYLGQLCATLVLALSPQRIVLGGGVAKTPGLVAAVHDAMVRRLGRYAGGAAAASGYLCAPQLDQDAGIVGALCYAVGINDIF